MVTIRMYNVGLGDCFLLQFEAPDRPRFILIDCGLFRGSDAETDTLKAVVANIADTTNSHLDVVVTTHEHQDHLSGFAYAKEVFEQQNVKIDEVWMAWTEDPADPMATQLRGNLQSFAQQLEQTVGRLKTDNNRALAPGAVQAVESVLEFVGFGELLGVDQKKGINQRALEFLKTFPVRYRHPNEVLTINGLPNIRFYVLGPPKSKLLTKSDPTKSRPEVYNFAGNERSNYALRIPAWSDDEDEETRADTMPFEAAYQLTVKEAQADDFFCKHYWENTDEDGNAQAYRRIDDDWLFTLGNLALQLDGDTNNTSLALAIELIDSKKVLLFPGDAQVGNWLSWNDCKWDGFDDLTAEKLLNRTVFYKVGHHGSHNATLKEQGLERMSSDLVAMIPVDRDFAQNTKKWKMPFDKLYTRLLEKTNGRVLIADSEFPHEKNAKRPANMTPAAWKAFRKNVTFSTEKRPTTKGIDRPLWVEFRI
jgi:beta-lactamase superfamily II metal-dependent hydrolase